jgi:hypothetical protein
MITIKRVSQFLSVAVCAVLVAGAMPAFAEEAPAPDVSPAVLAKVKQALDADPVLKKYDLDVEADHDAVALRGSVSTAFDKERAIKVASSVDGYKKLENVIHLHGVDEPNMGP